MTEKTQTKSVQKWTSNLAVFLRVIHELLKLGLLIVLIAFVLGGLRSAQKNYEQVKTIMALSKVVKNLRANYPVADITVTERTETGATLAFRFYRADGKSFTNEQIIQLPGAHIYIDCEVFNFSYSLIETGEVKNIAIPFRVYSDVVAPDEGIPLNNVDESGVPYVLYDTTALHNAQMQQLQKERLAMLMNILSNKAELDDLGIIRLRQQNSLANEREIRRNDRYQVRVEQSGGIVLVPKSNLF